MKTNETKQVATNQPVNKPDHGKKETSGDKAFDDAIDRMLKKPVYTAPSK